MHQSESNQLAGESSLYLQQHASNPVHWYPWGEKAWQKARDENKMVLISVGYSSCHWCHVMEKETFTDPEAARLMNENFVCIKVDREERPDVDQVYMSAVQLMTGSGGWPLNCFALPDGKPVYGGTYFPNNTWKNLLVKLNEFYRNSPKEAEQYASELTLGLQQIENASAKHDAIEFSNDTLRTMVTEWKKNLDNVYGGANRAPKFPLPNNYEFLLRYAVAENDTELLDHITLTLHKMAYGGIYDQLAGGFARYSTDSIWKVPHFEKMLYDNSQLISLYSQAYRQSGEELYRTIALKCIQFIRNEMTDANGSFYSSFDADSEGEEGKYYVWTKDEIKSLDLPVVHHANQIVETYFNINETGLWEKGNYILLRSKSKMEIAVQFSVTPEQVEEVINSAKQSLLKLRDKRIKPVLDKKIITSWNALHITALCEAYQAFQQPELLQDATHAASNILKNSVSIEGKLMHLSSDKKKITPGYLEDYAFTISAFIKLYQSTFDEGWIIIAKKFADDAIENYFDKETGLFWYTSSESATLITRKKEIHDNVIPSSNSEMAKVLHQLSIYYDDNNYEKLSVAMLTAVENDMVRYGSSFSNWALHMMNFIYPTREVVISGKNAEELRKHISSQYFPEVIFAGSIRETSEVPLLNQRYKADKTLVYICENRSCKQPVENAEDALRLLTSYR
jgi:uncharacterized protein